MATDKMLVCAQTHLEISPWPYFSFRFWGSRWCVQLLACYGLWHCVMGAFLLGSC